MYLYIYICTYHKEGAAKNTWVGQYTKRGSARV